MAEDSNATFRALFKGTGIIFLGTVFELGFSFLSQVLVARLFGKVDFGAISLGVTVLTFATTFSILGLNRGIGRNFVRYDSDADRRGVIVSAIQMAVPTGVVVGGAIAVFAPVIATRAFGDPSVGPILRIMGLTVPVLVFFRLCIGAIQAAKLSREKVVAQHLTIPVTRFALVAVVLLAGIDILGIAFAYAFAYVAAACVGLYYIYQHTPLFASIEATPLHGKLLRFSWPLIISATMTKILSDIDTFLLGVSPAASLGDIGVYRVIYPIASLLPLVLSSTGFLFLPVVSELQSEGETERMKRVYQVVTKWAVIATVPLFFAIMFSPSTVISLTFGPEYVEGATTLRVLSFAFFLPLILGPNSDMLTATGETRLVMFSDVVAAILNVVLNLLLIPRYSYLGAGIATTIAYAVQNVLYSAQVYRKTGIHPFTVSLFKPTTASFVLGGVLAWSVAARLSVTPLIFVASVAAFSAIHGVTVLVFGGVGEEEIMLLLSFEEQFGIDLSRTKRLANKLMR